MLDRRLDILRNLSRLTRAASGEIAPYPADLGDLRIVNANILWMATTGLIESNPRDARQPYSVTSKGRAWRDEREARSTSEETP